MGQGGESRKVDRIQVAATNAPLLDLCGQDVFTLLVEAVFDHLQLSLDSETTFEVRDGVARLHNPMVGKLAQAFTESGLGSYTDALLCIIPAFQGRFRISGPEHRQFALEATATAYRHTFECEKAETLLKWEYDRCLRLVRWEESPTLDASSQFEGAFRALLQHYRWMIADTASIHIRKRGIGGIRRLVESTRTGSDSGPEENASLWSKAILAVRPILRSYAWVADKVSTFDRAEIPYETATSVHEKFVDALQNGIRHEALFQLCIINQKDLRSNFPSSALPLSVRLAWDDVTFVLLEMEVSVDGQDSNGRTALSYCAELGLEKMARLLVGKSADVLIPDNHLRTPLSWAARSGHERIVSFLKNRAGGERFLNALDAEERSPLRWAIDGKHGSTAWLLIRSGAATQPPFENMGKFLEDSGIIDSEATKPYGLVKMMNKAVEYGHPDIVKQLLRRGVCINPLQGGSMPAALAAAAYFGQERIVQLLIDHVADVDLIPDGGLSRETPLRLALGQGYLGIARLLFEKGASLDQACVTDDEKRLLFG
ncbi:hypothetical protein K456DRAFT_1728547 [Colletotrichum gloeosporioides 23]|nr:hypothetical protein K456DRAFT_1728547 [Colletotrichum gloeosporioides 23]